MNITAIIISLIALVGAGFAFLRASSSHRILVKRIEKLKEKNTSLEQRIMRLEGASSRGNRPAADASESGRRNQPQQEQQEPRQKQKERRPHEERRPQAQPPQQQQQQQQQQEPAQHAPSRRKKENRRRNEPMNETNYQNIGDEQPAIGARPARLDFQDGDLLAELEQAAGTTSPAPAPVAVEEYSGKRYAIIPEDGFIRQHQLQQQPDSDSYIEVDMPADGSSLTHYRFNLSGNQAFVISQGIDRLENAFSFEKPSNRKVSQVVLQQDGVLARVNNGWKIQEKARIDFR